MRSIKMLRDALIGGEHAAIDSVVETDTDTADTLVRHRIAAELDDADGPMVIELADMTVAQLKDVALAEGIDLGPTVGKPKAQIVAAIEIARAGV